MFRLFGIPVYFSWVHFIVLAMLGGAFSASTGQDWQEVGLFVLAGFISILVHEFGHALSGRALGAGNPVIHLHAIGGICQFDNNNLSRPRDFLMTAAGPLAGYALAAALLPAFRSLPADTPPGIAYLLLIAIVINVVWSTINLLPVLPLDGGRLLDTLLGPKRRRITCSISIVIAAAAMVFGVLNGQILLAVLLGSFAWQNYQRLRTLPARLQ